MKPIIIESYTESNESIKITRLRNPIVCSGLLLKQTQAYIYIRLIASGIDKIHNCTKCLKRKSLSKVPLTPQFTTNGPKSNRNKIQVLSGLPVWIISWRLIDIGDTTSFLTFSKFHSPYLFAKFYSTFTHGSWWSHLHSWLVWKVENMRQFLAMRGLTKTGTKEELAVICFSACKLMYLVPLQDNKRCYDWNFRPPSNVFW